jgi:hypothetical protein
MAIPSRRILSADPLRYNRTVRCITPETDDAEQNEESD